MSKRQKSEQHLKASEILKEIRNSVTTSDRKIAMKTFGLTDVTISYYLNGSINSLDTAEKLITFFRQRIKNRHNVFENSNGSEMPITSNFAEQNIKAEIIVITKEELLLIIQDCIKSVVNNLMSLKTSNENKSKNEKWFTIESLIKYLPDHPAKQTIYGLTSSNKIPFHKKGKSVLFLKSEIDKWLKSGRRKARAEIMEIKK